MQSATKSLWSRAAVILLLTIVAYIPVMHAGFIWDDDDHLTANPAMTAPHGLRMIWSSLAVSRYYPLTLTCFWVQHRLWGLNPMPYHLFNIALHAINGVFVFLVLRSLRVPAAWFAAMVWALHPVNVESVAWITELKNTQSGIFFFSTLLCFLQCEADGRRRWYVLALLSGAGALLSKPSTVVLPLVLLLCVWWQCGRLQRKHLAQVAPFVFLSLIMSALTIVEQRGHIVRQGTNEWSLGTMERLAIAEKAIWFYAAKVLWPAELTFVYPRWNVGVRPFLYWLPPLGLVAAGAFLYFRRREVWARACLFAVGFYLAALLPVLGFLDIYYFRYSFVADHFQYLASLGIIAGATSGGAYAMRRAGVWGTPAGNVLCAALVLTLASLTWKQASIYIDGRTLWQDTVAKNPNSWMVHDNLGVELSVMGDSAGAIAQFQTALRIRPDDAGAHSDLAEALLRQGRITDAIGECQLALRINPEVAITHCNLGTALARHGDLEPAEREFRTAVRIDPNFAGAHNDLGSVLVNQRRLPEAIAEYQAALEINPNYANAHYNLGLVFDQLGRLPEAIRQYQETVRVRPDYAEAHYNLGIAMEKTGKVDGAVQQYQQALRIRPDYREAQDRLKRLTAGS